MILRNHGLLACGVNVPETWRTLFYLEKSCAAQLAAMAAAHARGRQLIVPPHEVCEHAAQQINRTSGTPAAARDWPAQIRLLDKQDPSYKH